jgi:Ran GTPase-activating protein (RanGAP) involved in mRNA processing and transport
MPLAAMVVFDPETGLSTIYHKKASTFELKTLKAKMGETIKPEVYKTWNKSGETDLFPKDWVPEVWLYFKEEESEEDDFLVDSSEELNIQEEEGSAEEGEDAEEGEEDDEVDDDEEEGSEEDAEEEEDEEGSGGEE